MFKNYVKTAFRSLSRNKLHTFINIAGLSYGMAVALLIGLWIWDEVSFDKDNEHYERIAQVIQNVTNNGEVQTWTRVPYPLADKLRKDYGQNFESVVLSTGTNGHILSVGDKVLNQSGSFMEAPATDLLSLKMVEGARSALTDQRSVLLSTTAARALFGDADPMGQLLKIDNQWSVKVAGVYKALPFNSSFHDLDFIGAWDLYYNNTQWIKTASEPWRPNAFVIYVQLKENADLDKLSLLIRDAKLKMVSAQLARKKPALFLQPMRKWHLYETFKDGLNTGGRIQYVWLFGIVGVFVLLMACINFMNLSTARSEKRAKEVGIRKTLGSLRSQLVYLFLGESLLMSVLSFVLSLLLVLLALPFFNQVADKQMAIPWTNLFFWSSALVFAVLTGLTAGSYPALYLSSFRPVKVLKGVFKAGSWAAVPRKTLVVLQFTISVVLVIGTIIVFKQIQFTKDRPIGYDSNGLVAVPTISEEIHTHVEAVRQQLLESGAITGMAEAGSGTTETNGSTSGIDWPGKDPNLSIDFQQVQVSSDYGKTVGWTLAGGRSFSKDFVSDSNAIVINETAARFMGLTHPVGQTIHWFSKPVTIVGVVRDMIMESPYDAVHPSVYVLDTGAGGDVIFRINPTESPADAIDKIGKVFKQYAPGMPFSYHFEDEEYARKFGNEERIGKLAGIFTLLAIFISCLGIFGLSSFVAEQRIKEIGVRKILGASVFDCWQLLSRDFVGLVIISLLISIPFSWYAMDKWLQNYRYHTGIPWWAVAASGVGALVITLLTVSYQAIRAARMNPVKSLRTE